MKRLTILQRILCVLYAFCFTQPLLMALSDLNSFFYRLFGSSDFLSDSNWITIGAFYGTAILIICLCIMTFVFKDTIISADTRKKIAYTVLCIANVVTVFSSSGFSSWLIQLTNAEFGTAFYSCIFKFSAYARLIMIAVTVFFTLKIVLGFKLTKKEKIAE